MLFLANSLPESSFIYLGLAMQAAIRASNVRVIPWAFVLVWTTVLVYRGVLSFGRAGLWAFLPAGGFLLTSLLFAAIFWPELMPLTAGVPLERMVSPAEVVAYPAQEDPNAEMRSAEDTGLLPESFRDPMLLSPGFRIMLPWLMDIPLTFGRLINTQSHRTFPTFLSLQWLLGTDLPSEATIAVQDWAQACYAPVLTLLQQQGVTFGTIEEFLPWGNTQVAQALANRSVIPGSQTGLVPPSIATRTEMPCDAYLNLVLDYTQNQLFELPSPAGVPFSVVFQEDLNLTPYEQALFLTYRAILPAISSSVPAPSLTGTYLALRGASIAGQAANVGSFTAAVGWLGGTFTWAKTLFGIGRGAMEGLFTEWQRAIDGLSGFVGMAVLLLWFAPYVLGLAQMTLLALFPFYFLWAFIPGRQVQPLISYFFTLLFLLFSPLWWAVIDVAQRLASAALAPQVATPGGLFGLGNSIASFAMGAFITVLGLGVVIVATSWALYGTLRSSGAAIFRAAV